MNENTHMHESIAVTRDKGEDVVADEPVGEADVAVTITDIPSKAWFWNITCHFAAAPIGFLRLGNHEYTFHSIRVKSKKGVMIPLSGVKKGEVITFHLFMKGHDSIHQRYIDLLATGVDSSHFVLHPRGTGMKSRLAIAVVGAG